MSCRRGRALLPLDGDGPVNPAGILATYDLAVGPGRLVLEVIQRVDGAVVTRLSRGGGVGVVLDASQVAALRVALRHCLDEMCSREGRHAA